MRFAPEVQDLETGFSSVIAQTSASCNCKLDFIICYSSTAKVLQRNRRNAFDRGTRGLSSVEGTASGASSVGCNEVGSCVCNFQEGASHGRPCAFEAVKAELSRRACKFMT